MANSSIFFSDFKSGRCSSTVQSISRVFQATMMVATMNVNRFATYMPNAFKALM
ncbi:hypothetical protein F2Q70_00013230 [Brassica cretica]|uniref:Uncharacterized protein n=2 Tax=Brassica cretica TaxID=69181 RepID=A0A8S9HBF3_BRACR|nr:hypothetical protein F2Q68_00014986 [Brassica cretica]KAF2613487.1 hypothetical protein F2Q70_00013230 [Brassica cretica]KAF3547259.1 hypothetical protein DY000_02009706 [Brassica cretica]